MMGDSKGRYEMSRALMNTLTPIREESNVSSGSGLSPRNIQKVRVNNRPIYVQTLPPDPSRIPPRSFREHRQQQPELRNPKADDSVEQVVEDYLHYAKYSAAIPVKSEFWDSNDSLYCPCCSKRNKENMLRSRGLPPENKDEDKTPQPADDKEVSRSPRAVTSPNQSWMAYQPLPYAATYLNPEFNRPSYIHQYEQETKADDSSLLTKSQVLESDAKFDQAMRKLRITTDRLDPEFDESKMSFS